MVKDMKRIFMFSLSLFLILAGCSNSAENSQEAETENDAGQTAAVPIEAEQMETELEPIDVSRMATINQYVEYYGTSCWKLFKAGQFVKGCEPSLALFPDATFVLTENLFAGMGTYRGTVEMDEYLGLVCKVESIDFEGFKGDDVKEIRFSRPNPWNLKLETELCGSVAGDQFGWMPIAAGAGSYISETDQVREDLKPAIEFFDDETFAFKENFLSGMGTYKGPYVYDDNQYICKVESINISGLLGTDVKEIRFHKLESGIQLATDLCMSTAGTMFLNADSVDTNTQFHLPSAAETYKKGVVFIVANADSNRIKVRNGPGLSAVDTGERMYNGNLVTVYEETVKDGYTWYRIGTDKWMAGNGTSFGIKYE